MNTVRDKDKVDNHDKKEGYRNGGEEKIGDK